MAASLFGIEQRLSFRKLVTLTTDRTDRRAFCRLCQCFVHADFRKILLSVGPSSSSGRLRVDVVDGSGSSGSLNGRRPEPVQIDKQVAHRAGRHDPKGPSTPCGRCRDQQTGISSRCVSIAQGLPSLLRPQGPLRSRITVWHGSPGTRPTRKPEALRGAVSGPCPASARCRMRARLGTSLRYLDKCASRAGCSSSPRSLFSNFSRQSRNSSCASSANRR